ncbi:MAG: hypothetical protein GW938_17585 [Leptospira sp.]|jgi:hypothetical protein|nr:hypothetical protein [Leptospira sp.]NCS92747.1 hypothetical protein [Leptospira sp.]
MCFSLSKGYFPIFCILLTAFSCNYKFIRMRIYPPLANKTYIVDNVLPGFQITDERRLDDKLGLHQPFFFKNRILKNEYGNLSSLLSREIQNHPDKYERILKKGNVHIFIKNFHVGTKDNCWSNLTSVDFQADVQYGDTTEPFSYYDKIESKVTDCFLIGSSITLVPLLLYVPYQGFRGNREDQVNQLGRNAVDAFLHFLEGKDYKPQYVKYNPEDLDQSGGEISVPVKDESISSEDES